MSPGQPLLTADLLIYASHVLVASAADRLLILRDTIAGVRRLLRNEAQPDLHGAVFAAPAALIPTTATREVLSQELGVPIQAILPADVDRLAAAIGALARWLVGQRIGLAFGAGGAKGLAHLGVLRVLRRIGLPIYCVAGTSIGAIVGAGVAQGISTEDLTEGLRTGAERVFRPTLPLFSILSNQGIARAMQQERLFGQRLIERLPLPFAASAADLTEGREIRGAARPGLARDPGERRDPRHLPAGQARGPLAGRRRGGQPGAGEHGAPPRGRPGDRYRFPAPLGSTVEASGDGAPAGRRPLLPNNIMRSRDIMMSEIRAHTAGEPALVIKPDVSGVQLLNFREGVRLIEVGGGGRRARPRAPARCPPLA